MSMATQPGTRWAGPPTGSSRRSMRAVCCVGVRMDSIDRAMMYSMKWTGRDVGRLGQAAQHSGDDRPARVGEGRRVAGHQGRAGRLHFVSQAEHPAQQDGEYLGPLQPLAGDALECDPSLARGLESLVL